MTNVGDPRADAGQSRGEVLKNDQRIFQLVSQFGDIRAQSLVRALYVPLSFFGGKVNERENDHVSI